MTDAHRFFECVKVQAAELDEVLPPEKLSDLLDCAGLAPVNGFGRVSGLARDFVHGFVNNDWEGLPAGVREHLEQWLADTGDEA